MTSEENSINCKDYNPNKACKFVCEGCSLFPDEERLNDEEIMESMPLEIAEALSKTEGDKDEVKR